MSALVNNLTQAMLGFPPTSYHRVMRGQEIRPLEALGTRPTLRLDLIATKN